MNNFNTDQANQIERHNVQYNTLRKAIEELQADPEKNKNGLIYNGTFCDPLVPEVAAISDINITTAECEIPMIYGRIYLQFRPSEMEREVGFMTSYL